MRARTEYLKLEELVPGETYIVDARNFDKAVWKVGLEREWKPRAFEGVRHKFGCRFLDTEYHWDEGAPYGTVKPIRVATDEERQEFLKEVKEL